MIIKFKIFEKNYKNIKEKANDLAWEPKLKVGDILDLSDEHLKKGARHFAEVTKVVPHLGIANIRSIKCNRKPYLCDAEHKSIIDCFDDSKLADMEIFKSKIRPFDDKDIGINISDNDPYGEEIWNEDSDWYVGDELKNNERYLF